MEEASSFEVKEVAAKEPKWRLTFKPDAFLLEPLAGGDPIGVSRAERVERTDLMSGMILRRVLVVKVAKKSRMFKLDPGGWEALNAWVGPPTLADLRKALRRRLNWTWPVGLLMVVVSLPLGGNPEGDIPPTPFDPVTCALGGALILMGLISRFVPNRIFFLLDGLWMGIAALYTVQGLLSELAVWPVFVLWLQIGVIKSGVREFLRFGAMTEDLAPKE